MGHPSLSDLRNTASLLERQDWIFAKTMPTNPHWYTLRRKWHDHQGFNQVVSFIREYGYDEMYQGKQYRVCAINGFKYWTMGAPISETILINRKPNDHACMHDLISENYDTFFKDEYSLHEDRQVLDMINYSDGASVLDIGCGTGLFIDYTPSCLPSLYTGIDPSQVALDKLVQKHPSYADRIVCSKLEDYAGSSYDLAIGLFGSPSYIPFYALQWIPQLLSPSGRFFLMFYQATYTPRSHVLSKWNPEYFYYSRQDLEKLGRTKEFNTYWIVEGAVWDQ